jgi:transcriptional regulator with XRE-family HTH domain
MTVTVRISRSSNQWIAEIPRARGFVASSPSLERLRKHVDRGLKEFFPGLAKAERREVFELPREAEGVLKDLAKAESAAQRAQQRASVLRKRASRRLRSRLGISVREVGALMGVSGGRAQQLLKD